MPMIIFIATWILVYLMYSIQIFDIGKIHGYTWIILLSSNVTIILGFYISYHFNRFNRKYYSTDQILIQSVDTKKLALIIISLFILSMISAIVNTYMRMAETGGLVEYFMTPMKSREIFVEKSREARHELLYFESLLAIFKNMNYVGIIFSSVLFASSRKYRFVCSLPLIFAFVESITTFGRFYFITNTFIWFSSVFFVSAHLPDEDRRRVFRLLLKTLGILIFIISLYFIFIVMFRTMAMKKYATSSQGVLELVGENVHSYFVGNLVMLDRYLLGNITYYYGASIFMNIIKWFNVVGLYENPKMLAYFYHYDFLRTEHLFMNTYTYIRYLYSDFGEASLIPLSFTWGFVTYKVLVAYLRKFTLARLYIVSLITYSLFMSFFFFYFKMLLVPLYCGITLYLIEKKTHCISTRKKV